INKRIHMEVPAVQLVTINEMVDKIGGPEELIVTVMFKFQGEMTGTVFFVLTIEEANMMIEQMTGLGQADLFKEDIIDEMAASALKELANIITDTYIAALDDMSGLHLDPIIPVLSVYMAEETLVNGMIDI